MNELHIYNTFSQYTSDSDSFFQNVPDSKCFVYTIWWIHHNTNNVMRLPGLSNRGYYVSEGSPHH